MIHLELSVREARSLLRSAEMMHEVFRDAIPGFGGEDHEDTLGLAMLKVASSIERQETVAS